MKKGGKVSRTIYCFRCGNPLITQNGSLYCELGEMFVSAYLEQRLKEETEKPKEKAKIDTFGNSSFFCAGCGEKMLRSDKIGMNYHCPHCYLKYDNGTTFHIIELHPHSSR